MLAKRLIPCLDVKNGVVVKGVQFQRHQVVGDIVELARYYSANGADELVFYDITATSEARHVAASWVSEVAKVIDIPFCVAGGIADVATAEKILAAGADKISLNSPAIAKPELITTFAKRFGQQCVVVGIDSFAANDDYQVYQYTGDPTKTRNTKLTTQQWVAEVQARGAGEIVLNCMNQDGVRQGYDVAQLAAIRELTAVPLIASGGAGHQRHFAEVFLKAQVDGALAASVFHQKQLTLPLLKHYLQQQNIEVRL